MAVVHFSVGKGMIPS